MLAADELPEGRVTTVTAGHKSVALVHFDGQFSALDNRCPHQGGPLGEGSIENGPAALSVARLRLLPARRLAARASTTRRSPTRSRSGDGEVYIGVLVRSGTSRPCRT